MKRWRYIIAAAMVAGNMAASAGAVYYEQVPQNVINDATTAYCQPVSYTHLTLPTKRIV